MSETPTSHCGEKLLQCGVAHKIGAELVRSRQRRSGLDRLVGSSEESDFGERQEDVGEKFNDVVDRLGIGGEAPAVHDRGECADEGDSELIGA